jgi:transcriptional regulator with XRE-family HTH domain
VVPRSSKGSGIPVDPSRVREARLAAGLSLGQVARDDVSRTFLLFVEQGKSRPSKRVLDLIAKRTRRPVSYFLLPPARQSLPSSGLTSDLAADLNAAAGSLRKLKSETQLEPVEQEALKLLELNLRQGAELARAIQKRASSLRSPLRLSTLRRGNKQAI